MADQRFESVVGENRQVGLKPRPTRTSTEDQHWVGTRDVLTTVIDPARFDAVIFDLDGVLTDTATVHAAAWKQLFDG